MKNLIAARTKSRQKRKKNFCNEVIILQSPPQNQVFCEISNYIRHEKLAQAIQWRELTESLEILAQYGFHGDLAIWVISYFQREEVVA